MGKPVHSSKSRAEQAIEAFQEADRIDVRPHVSFGDRVVFELEAKQTRERGRELLKPAGIVVEGAGEAVAWDPAPEAEYDPALMVIVNTLERPDSASVAASDKRLRAAKDAGVLETAVDATRSAQASNSLDRMLCHQMAAAHFQAMRLLVLSQNDRLAPVDVARYTNAASRLMDVYQAACLALQKLKTRGQQRVIVQHVYVGDGGQAVVAGSVRRGSRRKRRGRAQK